MLRIPVFVFVIFSRKSYFFSRPFSYYDYLLEFSVPLFQIWQLVSAIKYHIFFCKIPQNVLNKQTSWRVIYFAETFFLHFLKTIGIVPNDFFLVYIGYSESN